MAAPVKNTCPDIDKAIKIINSAIKDAEWGYKRHNRGSDDYQCYHDIINQIEDIPSMLEDLRSSNEQLREWGNELTNGIENSANYIYELEQKIELLEKNLAVQ